MRATPGMTSGARIATNTGYGPALPWKKTSGLPTWAASGVAKIRARTKALRIHNHSLTANTPKGDAGVAVRLRCVVAEPRRQGSGLRTSLTTDTPEPIARAHAEPDRNHRAQKRNQHADAELRCRFEWHEAKGCRITKRALVVVVIRAAEKCIARQRGLQEIAEGPFHWYQYAEEQQA